MENDYVASCNHPRYENGYPSDDFNFLTSTRRAQITMIETMDRNLQLGHTANGKIMGSVLPGPAQLVFDIVANDPDAELGDEITKIEIVCEEGKVVRRKSGFDAHQVRWRPTLTSVTENYYRVQVHTAERPETTAYLAPV